MVCSKRPIRSSHHVTSLPPNRRGTRRCLETERNTVRPARSSSSAIWQPDGLAATRATVEEIGFLDLRRENIASIIWATGYDYDYGWLKTPVLDAQGRPLQQRGVTTVPGLYFLGLHWMHTFKSGLLSGVGADAEYLATQIASTAGR